MGSLGLFFSGWGVFFGEHSLGLFSYFKTSAFAEQVVVVALLLFSLIAWTIMIGKWLELKKMRAKNYTFVGQLDDVSLLQKQGFGIEICPYYRLFQGAYEVYCDHQRTFPNDPHVMEPITNAIQRKLAEETLNYESKMVFLGSIVTGAPFLGLLGTIWGIMDAFGAVALQNSATIQALAPGIAGSLLATIAGLLVAIPSVFGYNFLLTESKLMTIELENFASILADRIAVELKGS